MCNLRIEKPTHTLTFRIIFSRTSCLILSPLKFSPSTISRCSTASQHAAVERMAGKGAIAGTGGGELFLERSRSLTTNTTVATTQEEEHDGLPLLYASPPSLSSDTSSTCTPTPSVTAAVRRVSATPSPSLADMDETEQKWKTLQEFSNEDDIAPLIVGIKDLTNLEFGDLVRTLEFTENELEARREQLRHQDGSDEGEGYEAEILQYRRPREDLILNDDKDKARSARTKLVESNADTAPLLGARSSFSCAIHENCRGLLETSSVNEVEEPEQYISPEASPAPFSHPASLAFEDVGEACPSWRMWKSRGSNAYGPHSRPTV